MILDLHINKQTVKAWFNRLITGYGLAFFIGFMLGACGFLVMRGAVFQFHVSGESMEPTLYDNEHGMGLETRVLKSGLKRGDIIAFTPHEGNEDSLYVKRIIGLPGEMVKIEDSKVYVDGVLVDEPYLDGKWTKDNGPYLFRVPDGCYLVMGDNRNESYDSRHWDDPYVKYESIEAKNYLIYWPLTHFKYLY